MTDGGGMSLICQSEGSFPGRNRQPRRSACWQPFHGIPYAYSHPPHPRSFLACLTPWPTFKRSMIS